MPLTITNFTGDGTGTVEIATNIELPDSGSSIQIGGIVNPVGAGTPQVSITGSPLTAPAVPGSGSTYWNIQIDPTTGAATVQTSSVSDPAPVGSNVIVFRQTLASTASTDLALDPSATPDTY